MIKSLIFYFFLCLINWSFLFNFWLLNLKLILLFCFHLAIIRFNRIFLKNRSILNFRFTAIFRLSWNLRYKSLFLWLRIQNVSCKRTLKLVKSYYKNCSILFILNSYWRITYQFPKTSFFLKILFIFSLHFYFTAIFILSVDNKGQAN